MNFATKITLLLGAFSAMAFSNALVPVLAEIAPDASVQGLLYAAYFFGAFATVFPVGWLSDKTGRAPLLKIGLFGTFASAILLFAVYPNLTLSVVFRALEGIFTGVFAAAAFSYVNSQTDHLKLSGLYIALMNIGMVAGLVISGFLAVLHPYAGVLFFGILCGIAAVASLFFRDANETKGALSPAETISVARYHLWLWVGIFMFTGVTGVVTSTYPELSGLSADLTGILTGLMSVATAVTVFVTSRFVIRDSLAVVRFAAICLALVLPLVIYSPLGIILVGAVYGVINAAVMDYIASTNRPQGVMNGLFLFIQYGGMWFLPVVAGFLAVPAGYLAVFLICGLLCLAAGLLIVRCPCYVRV
ncbi:MAG: MFS transporter [Methanocorpusculum sp.]|nr:MFS transporter [Methanocorpusculum sp.]